MWNTCLLLLAVKAVLVMATAEPSAPYMERDLTSHTCTKAGQATNHWSSVAGDNANPGVFGQYSIPQALFRASAVLPHRDVPT